MKKIMIKFATFALLLSGLTLQMQGQTIAEAEFQTPGLSDGGKHVIEKSLSTENGIIDSYADSKSGKVKVMFDPNQTDIYSIRVDIGKAGYLTSTKVVSNIENTMKIDEINIGAAISASCPYLLSEELEVNKGIIDTYVDMETNTIKVMYLPKMTNENIIKSAINNMGITLNEQKNNQSASTNKNSGQ